MRTSQALGGLGVLLALIANPLPAGEPALQLTRPACPLPVPCPSAPLAQPAFPGADPAAPGVPGAADAFAQAPEAGTQAAATYAPNMFGDLVGVQIYTPVILTQRVGGNVVSRTQILRTNPIPTRLSGNVGAFSTFNVDVYIASQRVPAGTPINLSALSQAQLNSLNAGGRIQAAGGATSPIFKIVENESPRPTNRVYSTYNYYNNVNNSLNPNGFPQTNIHREIIGFERTILDENASIGLRLPFFQVQGDASIDTSAVGDLNIILKYALFNDRETGNILSTGLITTVPTGADFAADFALTPSIRPVYFQPYAGGIYFASKDLFFQGFSSIVVPTDSRDVTFLSNDLAAGYFLYRAADPCARLSFVVPTFEVHVTTPLNHRGALTEPIGLSDIVNLTGGVTVGLGKQATLGIATVIPITGPRPWDIETQGYVNFRF